MTRSPGAAPFTKSDELAAALLALQVAGTVSAAIAQERNARPLRSAHDPRFVQILFGTAAGDTPSAQIRGYCSVISST